MCIRDSHGAVYLPEGSIPGLYDLVAGGGHFSDVGGKLQRLEFHFQGDDARLLFHQDNGTRELRLGMTGHFEDSLIDGTVFGANGAWRAHDRLEVEIRNTRMSTCLVLTLEFTGSKLTPFSYTHLPLSQRLSRYCTPGGTRLTARGRAAPHRASGRGRPSRGSARQRRAASRRRRAGVRLA